MGINHCPASARAVNGTRPFPISCITEQRTGGNVGTQLEGMGAPWTPDTARAEAQRVRGDVARKQDPAAEKHAKRKSKTVADLCENYLRDVEAGRLITRRRVPKKPSTIGGDRGRIERHIKPLLGRMKVAAVTRDDVETFMHDVAEGKTAIRTKEACKKRGLANVRGGDGHSKQNRGLAWRDLHLCCAPSHAHRQPRAWDHAACRWPTRPAPERR